MRDDTVSNDARPDAAEVAGCSDVGLVVHIERQNPAALGEVYRRHGGALHVLTTRVCGSAHAGGVVQEVLLELWLHPSGFNPDEASLRSLLLARAHGRATQLARADRPPRSAAATTPEAEHGRTATRLDAHAQRRLSRLTDDERTAILLAYLGGHSYQEVAVVLNQAPARVAHLIRTGLKALAAGSSTAGART